MALSVFYRIPVKSARGPVRKNVSVAFFMSMAIADLANGLIVMPLSLYAICNVSIVTPLEADRGGSTIRLWGCTPPPDSGDIISSLKMLGKGVKRAVFSKIYTPRFSSGIDPY